MRQRQIETLWVVVEVASGIPVTVEAFRDGESADKHAKFLRARMHPENDEIGVFEAAIHQECD